MTQARNNGDANPHSEEGRGLLIFDNGSFGSDDFDDDEDDDDLVVHSAKDEGGNGKNGYDEQRSTPRTPNRVRFDLTPEIVGASNGDARYMQRMSEDADLEDHRRSGDSHRVPLLGDIVAPSVTVANDFGDAEEWAAQEMRRPKSGLKSAFMNMANSIIGAGIIGQPYALRQAGLLSGILLLVGLTIIVDWTICLIVINSKLSGTSNFQGTVQHCFGRPGLIAISLAQWVFAFGGMVAFGVIVGDTIPHVLMAIWPDLPSLPVLGLLANRQIAIAVFTMSVSYPLTLYRDIAKLSKASTFALIGMVVIVVTVLVQGVLLPSEERGTFDSSLLLVNDGIFQSIGVISFGE